MLFSFAFIRHGWFIFTHMKDGLPKQNNNLPPGCTSRDIERQAGDWMECDWCGTETRVDKLNDDGLCRKCAKDLDAE